MTMHTRIARASAALAVAALLGAGTAAAEPLPGTYDGTPGERAPDPRSEALNRIHGLGDTATGLVPDAFEACTRIGSPAGLERFLCHRAAAVLATERHVSPFVPAGVRDGSTPPPRPIVAAGGGFDWTDAGVGFVAAAGIALIGAGAAGAAHVRRAR